MKGPPKNRTCLGVSLGVQTSTHNVFGRLGIYYDRFMTGFLPIMVQCHPGIPIELSNWSNTLYDLNNQFVLLLN